MPSRRLILAAVAAVALGGCASLPHRDPLQVTVAGVQALPGEGMELRMLLKLRVQNPNDAPVEYTGTYVELEVQGRTFATGVSSEPGKVPAFGEAVIAVPVTVSVLRMVRQVMGVLDGKPVDTIRYEMRGKLSGGTFDTVRFSSQGEFELPRSTPAAAGA
jgi:LEA14-like dessication related protein